MIVANLGHYRIKALLLLASMVFTLQAQGQSSPASPEPDPAPDPAAVNAQPEAQIKQLTNYVETGADYMTLTNGFGSWSGGYSRGVYQQGKNIWNGEITGQQEFGDAGVYFDAGDTYNFNPDWYGALTVGSSAGGFFWPRFRTDGFLNKKWLGRKQLITTLGVSYDMAKDVHRDHTFYLGTTYYFQKPWIVEEGLYFNISHPGAVFAPAGFVAVTQGHNKQQYITVRAGFGEEAYQLIGPTASLSQFNSETLTITWRKWMGPNWGFNFVGDYYHSPFYLRGGSTFGFFKEF
ncbi:MAG: YaiO family outer membrane beta-barrel protein [Terriglobales bacterium]|jgi:YaiO family outer membrane protein